MRRKVVVTVVVLLVMGCVVAAVVGGLAYFFRVPAVEARPVVSLGYVHRGDDIARRAGE